MTDKVKRVETPYTVSEYHGTNAVPVDSVPGLLNWLETNRSRRMHVLEQNNITALQKLFGDPHFTIGESRYWLIEHKKNRFFIQATGDQTAVEWITESWPSLDLAPVLIKSVHQLIAQIRGQRVRDIKG